MLSIKNRKQLTKGGTTPLNRRARELALESLEFALNAVDPEQLIRSRIRLHNSKLCIDERVLDLNMFRQIFVIGGGKASGSMAEAVESILGPRISKGVVNVPYGNTNRTQTIELNCASHPVPDENGVNGTRRMIQIANEADASVLVICLISGGGSSLMPLPRDSVSLDDKRKITDALLKSGANINEINTVRKHISDFKGGWLAKRAYPATVVNLILSDVVGDPLDFIASGPTVPDSTTFENAVSVLKRYDLWRIAAPSIRKLLSDGLKGRVAETPKKGDKAFRKVHNFVIGNSFSACRAVCECLRSKNICTQLLTSKLEGEARQIGTVLGSIAQEVYSSGNPMSKPLGIVAGGETTVTVRGNGLGGRNQEIPLSAAFKLRDLDGVVIASLTTDGVDGPTDAAGAIVDGSTLKRAVKLEIEPESYLAENDSYHFFSKLEDLIFTGSTGTNVNDISVIIAL